jgi:hypothetical protein
MRTMHAYRVGPMGFVPTTVLVLGVEYLPDSMIGNASPIFGGFTSIEPGSLADRLDDDEVWEWQRDLYFWRCRSIAMESSDPKTILRAVQLHGDLWQGEDFIQSVGRRFAVLLAKLSDKDPATRTAAMTLIGMTGGSLELQKDGLSEVLQGLPGVKAEILAQALGPNHDAAVAATWLLPHPDLLASLDAADISQLETGLTSPTVTQYRRWHLGSALARMAGTDPRIEDMVLRCLRVEDTTIRAQVFYSIASSATTPRLLDQLARAILTDEPTVAAGAARSVYRRDIARTADLREALLTRFGADQVTTDAFWPSVLYIAEAGSLSEREVGIVKSRLVRALTSGHQGSVDHALSLLAQLNDQSPELRNALDALIDSAPAGSAVARAREVRRKFQPPRSDEPK